VGEQDSDGFDEFYRGTGPRLLAYLYAVSGDFAEAQDAAQEAYARAWQHWGQVRRCDDPEQWVRTVGWRVLANRFRRLRVGLAARRREGPLEPVPPIKEDAVLLVTALRQLPRDQRIALVLHHILDLPLADIARQIGAPVGTVKARLTRGRRAMAALLGTEIGE
jgi:RNA polymerase sigma-70 factor (ECF subfamily)